VVTNEEMRRKAGARPLAANKVRLHATLVDTGAALFLQIKGPSLCVRPEPNDAAPVCGVSVRGSVRGLDVGGLRSMPSFPRPPFAFLPCALFFDGWRALSGSCVRQSQDEAAPAAP
jgi:hypothetical protein